MRNIFTNQENPLISIIVPIYNVEVFLKRCIDSLLVQTYTNIEILLINDGSTDGCDEICKSYKDQRVCYYYKENGGISDARNYGIAHTQGEYIAFVDSDDYVSPNFIEILYLTLKTNQTEISMCFYENFSDDICHTSLGTKNIQDSQIFTSDDFCTLFSTVLYYPAIAITWNKLYHRALFDDIQFPVEEIYEDEATTYKLLYKAQRISVVEDRLYYYYTNTNGIMHTQFSVRNLVRIHQLYDRFQFILAHGDKQFAKKTVRELYYFIAQVLLMPDEKINDFMCVRKELDASIRKVRPLLTGRYARLDIRMICFISCTKSHYLIRAHRRLLNWFWNSGPNSIMYKWRDKLLLSAKK